MVVAISLPVKVLCLLESIRTALMCVCVCECVFFNVVFVEGAVDDLLHPSFKVPVFPILNIVVIEGISLSIRCGYTEECFEPCVWLFSFIDV